MSSDSVSDNHFTTPHAPPLRAFSSPTLSASGGLLCRPGCPSQIIEADDPIFREFLRRWTDPREHTDLAVRHGRRNKWTSMNMYEHLLLLSPSFYYFASRVPVLVPTFTLYKHNNASLDHPCLRSLFVYILSHDLHRMDLLVAQETVRTSRKLVISAAAAKRSTAHAVLPSRYAHRSVSRLSP